MSGVLTYVQQLHDFLSRQPNTQARIISTSGGNIREWMEAIRWSNIVHMNSNDTRFALICKLLGRKLILKYHYHIFNSTHSHYRRMSLPARLLDEWRLTQSALFADGESRRWAQAMLVRLNARLLTAVLADQRIAVSTYIAQSCSLPCFPVSLMFNPIGIEQEDSREKTAQDLSSPPSFLFAGRLSKDKGCDILLEAAALVAKTHPDFRVYIAGIGEEEHQLKTKATELGIERLISFEGQLERQRVAQLMRSACAVIIPSRWNDPAPYVAMEAIAQRTCCVVSNMGGLPEIAGPDSLVFENENAAQLAELMDKLVSSPQEALERGNRSYQFALEHYSASVIGPQFLSLCDRIVPAGNA